MLSVSLAVCRCAFHYPPSRSYYPARSSQTSQCRGTTSLHLFLITDCKSAACSLHSAKEQLTRHSSPSLWPVTVQQGALSGLLLAVALRKGDWGGGRKGGGGGGACGQVLVSYRGSTSRKSFTERPQHLSFGIWAEMDDATQPAVWLPDAEFIKLRTALPPATPLPVASTRLPV